LLGHACTAPFDKLRTGSVEAGCAWHSALAANPSNAVVETTRLNNKVIKMLLRGC
jgi:hypothetical protein